MLNPSCPEVARSWILATNPWAKKAYDEAMRAAEPSDGSDDPDDSDGSDGSDGSDDYDLDETQASPVITDQDDTQISPAVTDQDDTETTESPARPEVAAADIRATGSPDA